MNWEDYIRLKGQQLANSMGGVYGMGPGQPPQQPMPKQNYYPMDMPPRPMPQQQAPAPRQFNQIQQTLQKPITSADIHAHVKSLDSDEEEKPAKNDNNKAGSAEGSYSGS